MYFSIAANIPFCLTFKTYQQVTASNSLKCTLEIKICIICRFCYVNCLKRQSDSVLLWITGPYCFSVSNRKGKDDKGSTWCTFPLYLQNSNSSYTGCHRDPSGSVHLLWSIPDQTWLFDCTHDPPVLKHPASVSGVQQKVAFPVKSEFGSYIQADISRCCPYTK